MCILVFSLCREYNLRRNKDVCFHMHLIQVVFYRMAMKCTKAWWNIFGEISGRLEEGSKVISTFSEVYSGYPGDRTNYPLSCFISSLSWNSFSKDFLLQWRIKKERTRKLIDPVWPLHSLREKSSALSNHPCWDKSGALVEHLGRIPMR